MEAGGVEAGRVEAGEWSGGWGPGGWGVEWRLGAFELRVRLER